MLMPPGKIQRNTPLLLHAGSVYGSITASVFAGLHVMQTRSSDENYVCQFVRLSVCQARDLWQTEERSVQSFISYETSFTIFFWEEKWWVGRHLPEILSQPAAVGTKSPILNRYSLVAPQP